MRDALLSALPLLAEPLRIVLLALAAYVARLIAVHVRNRDTAQLLVTLDGFVARVVADTYQGFVEPLKNADKPGAWTSAGAAAAKLRAVTATKQAAGALVAAVRAAGLDTDATLDHMVERAVVELNARLASPAGPVPQTSERVTQP